MDKNIIYDVVIITDRNYGLYTGFANGILGLKVLILEYFFTESKKQIYLKESKIWEEETRENYLLNLQKLKIEIFSILIIFTII